jgi:AcrR family transcriptional regulator
MSATKTPGSVRERLLKAADDLFYPDGVHTVGIDRILEHAGVAKASLYSTFKSKDELVKAYLDRTAEWLAHRIEARIATASTPKDRILAVFDEFADRVAEDVYYGCPFVRACAEMPRKPTPARVAAAAQRAWLRDCFTRLSTELGASDASGLSRQLALIYDGATVSVSMDHDPGAAISARKIAERLLSEYEVAGKKSSRSASRKKNARASS